MTFVSDAPFPWIHDSTPTTCVPANYASSRRSRESLFSVDSVIIRQFREPGPHMTCLYLRVRWRTPESRSQTKPRASAASGCPRCVIRSEHLSLGVHVHRVFVGYEI